MNGPSHFNPSHEVIMPKEEQVTQQPKWTPNDIRIANDFLAAMRMTSGAFNEKKDFVARGLGYQDGYKGLGPGVLAYISHIALESKKRKAKNKKNADEGKRRMAARMKKSLIKTEDTSVISDREELVATLQEDWIETFRKNPNAVNEMIHPDDKHLYQRNDI